MHIPDGFLSSPTWISTWLLSAGGIGYALRKTAATLSDRMVPLMGVTAAFIFAAQMVNFPVLGGTSGHLLGGVLAAVLLGPYAGAVILTCVLAVQCLIFQDGGLTALGANIFNMALVGTIGGYGLYRLVGGGAAGGRRATIGLALAAWFSVFAAACACAVELAFSGVSPLTVVLPAMGAVHAVIGIGEAIITCLVVGVVRKLRPDLLYGACLPDNAGPVSRNIHAEEPS